MKKDEPIPENKSTGSDAPRKGQCAWHSAAQAPSLGGFGTCHTKASALRSEDRGNRYGVSGW